MGDTGNVFTLIANGGSTDGSAGDVEIGGDSLAIVTAGGTAVSASAIGGDGDGGNVLIFGDSFTNEPGTGVTIFADAHGLGNPKEIDIYQSGDTVPTKLVNATISASADKDGDGKGGTIQVFSAAQISIDGATFTGKASDSGENEGGHLTISSNGTIDMSSINSKNISMDVRGSDSGEGGTVEINDIGEFPAPNQQIKVSSGENVTDTDSFGGSVSLNFVTCQRTLTGDSGFPAFYWNCVNPGAPVPGVDDIPVTEAESYSGTLKSSLSSVNTNIYVMVDKYQAESFFAHALAPLAGYTFPDTRGGTDSTIADVLIFQNGDMPYYGYTSFTEEWIKEVANHELGHALDLSAGVESNVLNPDYNILYTHDTAYLDEAGPPCVEGGAGPFNGIIDFQTRDYFCSNSGEGGELNEEAFYTNPLTSTLLSNSQIAAKSQPVLNVVSFAGVAATFTEIYAQTFAYQIYAQSLSFPDEYIMTTADGLFAKGFYGCTQQFAATLAGLSYTPGYACSSD